MIAGSTTRAAMARIFIWVLDWQAPGKAYPQGIEYKRNDFIALLRRAALPRTERVAPWCPGGGADPRDILRADRLGNLATGGNVSHWGRSFPAES